MQIVSFINDRWLISTRCFVDDELSRFIRTRTYFLRFGLKLKLKLVLKRTSFGSYKGCRIERARSRRVRIPAWCLCTKTGPRPRCISKFLA